MSIRKNFTIIPNEILGSSQLSTQARYLYCVLLRYCGKDSKCFPSQNTLALVTGFTVRHIRNIIKELIDSGLIDKQRRGWNRSNTYEVAKELRVERNGVSYHIGSLFPLHQDNKVPPKNTYLKAKGKKSVKGLEDLRKRVIELELKKRM